MGPPGNCSNCGKNFIHCRCNQMAKDQNRSKDLETVKPLPLRNFVSANTIEVAELEQFSGYKVGHMDQSSLLRLNDAVQAELKKRARSKE